MHKRKSGKRVRTRAQLRPGNLSTRQPDYKRRGFNKSLESRDGGQTSTREDAQIALHCEKAGKNYSKILPACQNENELRIKEADTGAGGQSPNGAGDGAGFLPRQRHTAGRKSILLLLQGSPGPLQQKKTRNQTCLLACISDILRGSLAMK